MNARLILCYRINWLRVQREFMSRKISGEIVKLISSASIFVRVLPVKMWKMIDSQANVNRTAAKSVSLYARQRSERYFLRSNRDLCESVDNIILSCSFSTEFQLAEQLWHGDKHNGGSLCISSVVRRNLLKSREKIHRWNLIDRKKYPWFVIFINTSNVTSFIWMLL